LGAVLGGLLVFVISLNEETWVSYQNGATKHKRTVFSLVLSERYYPPSAFSQATPYSAASNEGSPDSWHIAIKRTFINNPFRVYENYEGGRVLNDMRILGKWFTLSERHVSESSKKIYIETLLQHGTGAAANIVPKLEEQLIKSAEQN